MSSAAGLALRFALACLLALGIGLVRRRINDKRKKDEREQGDDPVHWI